MDIGFSTFGIGGLLARTFDRAAQSCPSAFPNIQPRGQTLIIAADFSGQHKGPQFDTYAFLVLDLERNSHWFEARHLFRETAMPNTRRMSFKDMNDSRRRQALLPFLGLAEGIEGWLVLVAVSKAGGSLFTRAENTEEAEHYLAGWKRNVRERLLRILHLSSFLLSGLAVPGQDVLWISDEDEIASNTLQLTQLTKVLARISSNSIHFDLRQLRCGTTRSDDGTLSLEDLVAVPDLAAGAFSDVATAMVQQGLFPRRGVISALPPHLSWKSRVLATWLAMPTGRLRRLCCLIDLSTTSQNLRATMVRWHMMPSMV